MIFLVYSHLATILATDKTVLPVLEALEEKFLLKAGITNLSQKSAVVTSSSMSLLAILFRLMRVLMTGWLALSSSVRKARLGYSLALLLEIVHINHSKLATFY